MLSTPAVLAVGARTAATAAATLVRALLGLAAPWSLAPGARLVLAPSAARSGSSTALAATRLVAEATAGTVSEATAWTPTGPGRPASRPATRTAARTAEAATASAAASAEARSAKAPATLRSIAVGTGTSRRPWRPRAAGAPRRRLVDADHAPVELRAVQRGDRPFRLLGGGHLDEA